MVPTEEPARRRRSPRASTKEVDYDDTKHLVPRTRDEGAEHDDPDSVLVQGGYSEREECERELVQEKELDSDGESVLSDLMETESLYEEMIESLREHDSFFANDPEACTREEAARFRQMLRTHGPDDFCKMTVEEGHITAKKMLTAFGIRVPDFLDGADDEAFLSLLHIALIREMHKRTKLPQYNSIDDAVKLMKKAKNVMVLTGAGISTSLGIPDFRSKGIGLYSKLEHLGLNDPQEVFDIRVFKEDPAIFYSIAKDIIPSTDRFTPTHAFIRLLQDKDKLLTNYSQNIDNIEAKAGIQQDKLIQCHGSFATASCVKCKYRVPGEDIFDEVRAGKIPRCKKCSQSLRATNNSKKRKVSKDGVDKKTRRRPGHYDSNSDSEYDMPDPSFGVMKPDITFFGEPLPDQFHDRLTKHDKDKVDLCIVIGTSLKVAPVSEVVSFLPPDVPAIYISRTPVNHINFDIDLLGDCDVVVAELCRRADWNLDHEMIPKGQKIKTELVDGTRSQHVFTVDTTQLPQQVKENSLPRKEAKSKQPGTTIKGSSSSSSSKSRSSTPAPSSSATRTKPSSSSSSLTNPRAVVAAASTIITAKSREASPTTEPKKMRSREGTPAKQDTPTPSLTASTEKLTMSGGTPTPTPAKKLSIINGKLAFT